MAFTSLVEVAIKTVLVGDVQCMNIRMIGKVPDDFEMTLCQVGK